MSLVLTFDHRFGAFFCSTETLNWTALNKGYDRTSIVSRHSRHISDLVFEPFQNDVAMLFHLSDRYGRFRNLRWTLGSNRLLLSLWKHWGLFVGHSFRYLTHLTMLTSHWGSLFQRSLPAVPCIFLYCCTRRLSSTGIPQGSLTTSSCWHFSWPLPQLLSLLGTSSMQHTTISVSAFAAENLP